MTNYLLPETDRIAADVNPLFEEIAGMKPEHASLVEVGAITVIGLLGEAAADLLADVKREAVSVGVSEADAEAQFNTVFSALQEKIQPRLNAMREAVRAAQGEPDLDAMVAGLLAGFVDEEAAAGMLAFFEDEDEEDEDDDEDMEVTDEDVAAFLNAIFASRP